MINKLVCVQPIEKLEPIKLRIFSYSNILFLTLVYPKVSYVINPERPSVVCGQPVYKYLRDGQWVFLIFCMKLGHHKGTKVTGPDF